MGFWMALFIQFAFMVVGELLRPKPKFDSPRPSSLGDFQFPTAEESRIIPVVYGTVKIKAPNVVWWGDLRIEAIKKKVKTGLFSSTTITQGYKYHLGMQAAICWGYVDAFLGLEFGGKTVVTGASETADVFSFTMDKPTLLSADEPPNGVKGPVKIYRGSFTQTQNDYLADKWGEATIPAFRGVCHAVFEHCYLGNNDVIPEIAFTLRRTPNTLALTGNKHIINGDANPLCAVYEIMTNTFWGGSIPGAMIDTASFVAAAETCFGEGLGISMVFDTPTTVEAAVAEILRHVDGVLYIDTDGKWKVSLARDDYDVEALPELNESNIEPDSLNFSRGSWSETKNTVIVGYIDREHEFTERSVQWQNLANIDARGGQYDAERIDFKGLSNATAAGLVSARTGKTISVPLAKIDAAVNRAIGLGLRPGGVFKFKWSPLGIDQIVFRITDIDRGSIEDPTVKVKGVEDIFSISGNSYSAPVVDGWENPYQLPTDMDRKAAFELAYGMTNSATRYVGVMGSPSRGIDTAYRIWQSISGGAYVDHSTADFTPSGVLTSDLARNSTASFTINSGVLLGTVIAPTAAQVAAGEAIAVIQSNEGIEFIGWTTLTDNGDGTWTVGGPLRGQYDAPPLKHTAGAIVWFISDGVGVPQESGYTSNVSLNFKLAPFNREGELAIGSATAIPLTLTHRANKPYPPGNFRVNDVYYPTTISGAATFKWLHRNKVDQGYNTVAQTTGGITPEAGTTYTLKLYDQTNTLRRTETGLTGETYAWTTESVDSGLEPTRSLLHFNGVNGSTTFVDESGKIWTANGNAQISTSSPILGSGSLLLDGTGDWIDTPVHADFNFGASNFNIVVRVRPAAPSAAVEYVFTTRGTTGAQGVAISYTSGQFAATVWTGSAVVIVNLIGAMTVTAGTNYYVELSRSGNDWFLFVNGTAIATGTASGTVGNAALVNIGRDPSGSGPRYMNGRVDEFRVQPAIAGNTANYTPPAGEFTYGQTLNTSIRAVLTAVKDGIESNPIDHTVTRV